MNIDVIQAIGSATAPAAQAASVQRGSGGEGFSDMLEGLIKNADQAQKQSDQLVESLASGEPTDVHHVVLAMSQADLSFRTLLEVRNRLVEAYREIQRMPV